MLVCMANINGKIERQLRKAGWILKSTGKHQKWVCGCGDHGPVIKATTVGGGRGAQNFRSFMRKQGGCSVDIKLG